MTGRAKDARGGRGVKVIKDLERAKTETESPCPESTEDLVCRQLDDLCHCYLGFCDNHHKMISERVKNYSCV